MTAFSGLGRPVIYRGGAVQYVDASSANPWIFANTSHTNDKLICINRHGNISRLIFCHVYHLGSIIDQQNITLIEIGSSQVHSNRFIPYDIAKYPHVERFELNIISSIIASVSIMEHEGNQKRRKILTSKLESLIKVFAILPTFKSQYYSLAKSELTR